MERVNIALARLERVKELLKSWQQKKSVSNIERSIALNQLAALYDELFDIGMPKGKAAEAVHNKAEELKHEVQQASLTVTEAVVAEKESEPTPPVQTPPTLNSDVAKDKEQKANKEKEADFTTKQETKDKTVRLGDKLAGAHKYLYENFEHQDDTSIARFSAIDDINRAIGINDRFLYIKELFNGDKDIFNKAISTLNSYSSLDDALMYIHENFSWDSENPTVKQLILLLYRRFK